MITLETLTAFRDIKKTFKDIPTQTLKKFASHLQKLIKQREDAERVAAEKAHAERQQIEEFEALMKEANINPETLISHLTSQKKRKKPSSHDTQTPAPQPNSTTDHKEHHA